MSLLSHWSETDDVYGAMLALPAPESRQHAYASASGSKCWMECTAQPGFVTRNRHRLPENNDSDYSREGTRAHDGAAQCLLLGYDAGFFGEDKDMARFVKGYVDTITGWVSDPGWELLVEQEVPLFYHPEETGWMDAGAVKLDGTAIRIGDLKYGAGISVQAKHNTQLAIYGWSLILSLWSLYNFTEETVVTLMIYQPRVKDEQAKRIWVLTIRELRAFCAAIDSAGRAIYANRNNAKWGKFSPSDSTCQFCDAISICGDRAAQLFGEVPREALAVIDDTQPVPTEFPFPELLTTEQLARIVAVAPAFKAWLVKCEAVGAHRLSEGMTFPGFKLVEGRSNRKWRNDEEAAELLGTTELPAEEVYAPMEVISPAQAQEKLSPQDWAKIKHLVIKPPGRPTMVPESHKKEALLTNGAGIFDNLEEVTDLLK